MSLFVVVVVRRWLLDCLCVVLVYSLQSTLSTFLWQVKYQSGAKRKDIFDGNIDK